MNQFIVEKQNKRNFTLWASRVLTVDPAERCFYLSRKDDAHDVTYHKILVSKVYFWPDFGSSYVMDAMRSSSAQATLRLRGREVAAAHGDAARVEETTRQPSDLFANPLSPLRPPEEDMTAAKGARGAPPPHPRERGLSPAATPAGSPNSSFARGKGQKVHWMLRLSAPEEVATLKNLLLAFDGCTAEGKATYVVGAGDASTGPPSPTPEGLAGSGGSNDSPRGGKANHKHTKGKKGR